MTTTQPTPAPRTEDAPRTEQRHRVWIRATPEAIWEAITDPAQNGRYGYGAPGHYDLRPGGDYRSYASEAMKRASAEMGWPCPDTIVDGEVLEAQAPRRLVQTWRMLMDPGAAAEGFSRITWEIEGPGEDGVCRLTLTHAELGPHLAAMVQGSEDFGAMGGGGWPWILSDLKSYLETGRGFAG
jgi:uncharacterized protein YndB with AHSA1/START domain